MLVFVLGRIGREAGVGEDAAKHLVEMGRVLLGDRRAQHAGKGSCGVGKGEVGVHRRELPARRVAHRQGGAPDLLIESEAGGAERRRGRQQRSAVGQPLFRQIALEERPG